MTDDLISRRFLLAAAAATPSVPALFANDRIAIFSPPPERTKIASVGFQFTAEEVNGFKAQGKNIEMMVTKSRDEFKALAPEIDVAFGAVPADALAVAKNLRWMQHTEAGMDNVLYPELIKSPVVVTNMARMFAPAISETAISMLLALTRGLNKYFIPQFAQKKYYSEHNLVEVDGLTMGFVGMGGLGQATAQRAHYGFNMRILAVDAKPMIKPIFVETLREPEWLMEMVPQCDILVNSVPLTKETKGMFNEKVFGAMKKTAYVLSISRGPNVDQTALAKALKSGAIAGAGLDVTDPEPLPPGNELWECPNTIITAHSAGYSPQRRIRQMSLITENVRRYTNGLPLMNVVDKVRGY
jgi:phosphoglycerate dehydrogenase-like enzyme